MTTEILNRLRKGESAETIAAELTDAINAAVEAHEAETAEKSNKIEDTEALMKHTQDYLEKYYPNTTTELGDPQDMIDLLDMLLDAKKNPFSSIFDSFIFKH